MTAEKEVIAVRGALLVERDKWNEMAGILNGLKGQTAALNLMPSAFFGGDPVTASQLSRSYDEIYALIRKLMTAAEEEFIEIGGALQIASDRYDGADWQSAETLEAIYGK